MSGARGWLCGVGLCLVPAMWGCAQGGKVVRGQGPGEMLPGGPQQAMVYDQQDHYPSGTIPGYYNPDECHVSGIDPRSGLEGYEAARRLKYKKEKRNYVYPPANDVPAVVQYPYYTCKGPDCFFFQ